MGNIDNAVVGGPLVTLEGYPVGFTQNTKLRFSESGPQLRVGCLEVTLDLLKKLITTSGALKPSYEVEIEVPGCRCLQRIYKGQASLEPFELVYHSEKVTVANLLFSFTSFHVEENPWP